MIKLSAFADEISPELDEQIRVCKRNAVTHFELRGVYGKNVLDFDNALLVTQQFCVGLDVGKHTTDIGGLLRRHAAMSVEIDRNVSHEGALASMRCASERSIELIEIISIEECRGAAPGTMIKVATRR